MQWYVIESKNSPRGAWKRSKYGRPMTLEQATALAQSLEEHGNTVRVVPAVADTGAM